MVRLSFSVRLFVMAALSLLCMPIVFVGSSYPESWLWLLFSGIVLAASVLLSRGNPIDPRVWFPVFGGLYSFSFFILHMLGEETAGNFRLGVFLGYIFVISAIMTMWLASAVKEPSLKRFVGEAAVFPRTLYPILCLILVALLAYVLLDATFVLQAGLSDKRALNAVNVGLPGAGTALNWSLFLYVLVVWSLWHRIGRRYILISLIGVLVLYVWGATGERDALFKWVLITAFLLLFSRSVSLKFVYILGAVVFFSLPLTKDLGVLLSSDTLDLRRTENMSVWVFKLEWKSAGQNFDYLLERQDLYRDAGAKRFVGDVYRGLIPGELFSIQNTRDWYYSEYAPVVTGRDVPGAGFSYVGSWYVYANIFGVVLGGCVFGLFSWVLYLYSYKNMVWNGVYLVFVPLAIWSLRMDFSGILSSAFKQSIVPAIFVFVLLLVLRSLPSNEQRKFYGEGRVV